MKIRIADIGPNGLQVKDKLNFQKILERIQDNKGLGLVFKEAPAIDILIQQKPGGADANGELTFSYTQECGRCLEPLVQNAQLKLSIEIKRHSDSNSDTELDDRGIVYFKGDLADIEDYLIDTVFLAIDPFLLPALDSKHKCLECKKDFSNNEMKTPNKVSLGDVLKKAGIE